MAQSVIRKFMTCGDYSEKVQERKRYSGNCQIPFWLLFGIHLSSRAGADCFNPRDLP
jgi:hypothetical protein